MAHQVVWTSKILELFKEKALLTEDEMFIMESRIKGHPVTYQAQHLNCSEATVHRMISKLKKKYDQVQKEFPEHFPPRRYSTKETWMDTH